MLSAAAHHLFLSSVLPLLPPYRMAPPQLQFVSYIPPTPLGTPEEPGSTPDLPPKRGRGRPKGSKNKVKDKSSTQTVRTMASGDVEAPSVITQLGQSERNGAGMVEELTNMVRAHFL